MRTTDRNSVYEPVNCQCSDVFFEFGANLENPDLSSTSALFWVLALRVGNAPPMIVVRLKRVSIDTPCQSHCFLINVHSFSLMFIDFLHFLHPKSGAPKAEIQNPRSQILTGFQSRPSALFFLCSAPRSGFRSGSVRPSV